MMRMMNGKFCGIAGETEIVVSIEGDVAGLEGNTKKHK